MPRGLDHIVHAVRNLDAAADLYRRLGFTVGARNRHPWGTHNHIVQFPGFFIELLTLAEPDKLGSDGFSTLFGAYDAVLTRGSRVSQIYGATEISERHRHRYEVNTAYKGRLEQRGMRFSGMSPDGILPEIIEYEDHPWFIGVQFHPELKSRPFEPHPLFSSFIGAAVEQSRLV